MRPLRGGGAAGGGRLGDMIRAARTRGTTIRAGGLTLRTPGRAANIGGGRGGGDDR
jgi:hypothetical protein